jgi:hypothetical protein
MLQDVLADEEWAALIGLAERRGLTPLFWRQVRPYGRGPPRHGLAAQRRRDGLTSRQFGSQHRQDIGLRRSGVVMRHTSWPTR